MLSREKIRPKRCQLLNTAVIKNDLFFNDQRSSTGGFNFDDFLHTKNKTINLSTKNKRNNFDAHFKIREPKRRNTSFMFLAEALHKGDSATKLKWTKQLIFKLNLIYLIPKSSHNTIDIECLKIDAENDLIVDLNLKNENSYYKPHYLHPSHYFGRKLSYKERDIWTTGICIYYINTLSFPWKKASLNDKDFKVWIKEGKFKDTVDEPLLALLKDMLNVNQRLSMKVIINKLLKIKPNQKAMSKF